MVLSVVVGVTLNMTQNAFGLITWPFWVWGAVECAFIITMQDAAKIKRGNFKEDTKTCRTGVAGLTKALNTAASISDNSAAPAGTTKEKRRTSSVINVRAVQPKVHEVAADAAGLA